VVSGFLLALSACVTVNVNFPETAVQKATDDYVRELYRAKEKGKTPPPASAPSGTPSTTTSLGFGFPAIGNAEAAGPNFQVDSPKALSIRDNLAKRLEEVLAQKRAGVIGESNDGFLVLKAPEKLKKLFQRKVEKLVVDENTDRRALYDEVLVVNSAAKNRLKDIQMSFARSFQAESPSGTWIQAEDGSWSQKP